jgi:hypothetical protein
MAIAALGTRPTADRGQAGLDQGRWRIMADSRSADGRGPVTRSEADYDKADGGLHG